MTHSNQDRVDEDLLRELGLGQPVLEGEAWNLDDLAQETPPDKDDFLATLDAIQLLQDLGKMDKQLRPTLEPPSDEHARDLGEELLKLLDGDLPLQYDNVQTDLPPPDLTQLRN